MSSLNLGKVSTLSVSGTAFAGLAVGTDNLVLGATRGSSVVPGGRGRIGVQVARGTTYDFSFVTDANSVTDPVLRSANGKRQQCVFSDGQSTYTFSAIPTVTLAFDYINDRETYTIAMAVDGAPSVS